jgi:putative redox protein
MDNSWREVSAEWQSSADRDEPIAFIGYNAAGGSVQMGKIANRPGISPMELLLVGLAGCTGMDIVSILQKQRQPLQELRVRVRGKRADSYPMVFTEIEVVYLLWGEGIDPIAVERAIQLSEEKYCSVGIMLGKAATIQSSYQILKPGEGR